MSTEQPFYECTQCKNIFALDDPNPSRCTTCGEPKLKLITGRFIIRCKTCGLTQNKKAYAQMHSDLNIRCQNSTCNGAIRVVQLGAGAGGSMVPSSSGAPRPNTSGRTQQGGKVAQTSSNNLAPQPAQRSTPQIPPRPGLRAKDDIQNMSSMRLSSVQAMAARPQIVPIAQPAGGSPGFSPFPTSKSLVKQPNSAFPLPQAAPVSSGPKIKDHAGIRPGDFLDINGTLFEIIKKLGTGGMGAVHQGKNTKTGELVAIKEFFYTRYHDPESGENHCEKYWSRESRLSQIQSESPEPCMHYFGSMKLTNFNLPEYYIILEYITGKPLDEWYTDRYKDLTKLTIKECRMIIHDILMPIARHMYFVAQKGIVHRDLTVQNVMIRDQDGKFTPIIIDWGVSKEIGVENMYNPRKPYYVASAPEATGIRNRGTPPEVMAGFQPIAVTDVYMLGHIMYYMFSGGNYCGTATTNEDFVLHPADLNPDLPSDFNKVVEYMTQYEPADRMPNMIKVYEALQWLYTSTEALENPQIQKISLYLHCDYNDAYILLEEKKVVRLGREEIMVAGQNHDYDGHLFSGLVSNAGGKFQFELYIDGGYCYVRDKHSIMGTFLNNLTAYNQQVYNNVPIKGLDNVVILISPANIGKTTIEVPFKAPDGLVYRITFKLVQK